MIHKERIKQGKETIPIQRENRTTPYNMSSISGVKNGLSLLTKAEVAHLKSRSRLIFNNLPNPSILGPEKEILESKSQPSLSPFTVPEKSLSLR